MISGPSDRMVLRKICGFAAVCVFLLGTWASALDLDEILDLALKNDRQLVVLESLIRREELNVQRADLEPVFALSAGTGASADSSSPGMTYTRVLDEDTEQMTNSLEGTPTILANLGDPLETSISVAFPVSWVSKGEGNAVTEENGLPVETVLEASKSTTVSPIFTVRQPLNSLLGLDEFELVEELSHQYAVAKARVNYLKRRLAVQKTTLLALKELIGLQMQIEESDRAVKGAREALRRADLLGTYSKESTPYRRLQYELEDSMRRNSVSVKRLALRSSAFERILGGADIDIPDTISFPRLNIPTKPYSEGNAGWYLSRIQREIASARLQEVIQREVPSFSVGVSYGFSVTSSTGSVTEVNQHEVSGSLAGEFEQVSVSGTVGGIIDENRFSVSIGFFWSLPDNRAENMLIEEAKLALSAAESDLQMAEEDLDESLAILELDFLVLSDRVVELEDETRLSRLELEEAQKKHAQGIINDSSLAQSEWGVRKLEFDEKLLRLDGYLLNIAWREMYPLAEN